MALVELQGPFDEDKQHPMGPRQLERSRRACGLWRSGLKPHQIMHGVVRKRKRNVLRSLPCTSAPATTKLQRLPASARHRPALGPSGNLAGTAWWRTVQYLDEGLLQNRVASGGFWCPVHLCQGWRALIERRSAMPGAGGGAIRAKNECAGDPGIIAPALNEASQAGVQHDLLIRALWFAAARGAVSSDTSGVQSYHRPLSLEHSRLFLLFANNGEPEIFFRSADWMPANLDRA